MNKVKLAYDLQSLSRNVDVGSMWSWMEIKNKK